MRTLRSHPTRPIRATAVGMALTGLTALTLAYAPSPASAATTFSQAARCEAGEAFLDLSVTNTDAPTTVDVRLDDLVLVADVQLPTGDTVVPVSYTQDLTGSQLSIVAAGTVDELSSAPVAERPACGNPSIVIATSSRCTGDDLEVVIDVTNDDAGDLTADVTFGGGPIAEDLLIPAGTSAELVVPFPAELTPETQELATIVVTSSATDEVQASAVLDAQGQVCVAPEAPDVPDAPDATPRPVPAAPIVASADYTG